MPMKEMQAVGVSVSCFREDVAEKRPNRTGEIGPARRNGRRNPLLLHTSLHQHEYELLHSVTKEPIRTHRFTGKQAEIRTKPGKIRAPLRESLLQTKDLTLLSPAS